ncbi:MAG: hypothetical protein P4M14_09630 [Gammaproteobacteria bacterium]|nr:hypothetical protein [Gammaproteobacteria bacterium]
MFRTNNKSLTQNDLVVEILSMLKDSQRWADKALKNKQVLTESLSFLFRNRKPTLYSNAQEFLKALDQHLSINELSPTPAVRPIFDRTIANFFQLYQNGVINMALGNLFAGVINDNPEARETLRSQLKHHQSFPNLQLILEGINPGMSAIRQNLRRIDAIEEAEAAEAFARNKQQQAIDDNAKQILSAARKLQVQVQEFEAESSKHPASAAQPLSPIAEETKSVTSPKVTATAQPSFKPSQPPQPSQAVEAKLTDNVIQPLAAALLYTEANDEREDSDSFLDEEQDRNAHHFTDTTDEESKESSETESKSDSEDAEPLTKSASYFLDYQLQHALEEEEEEEASIGQHEASMSATNHVPPFVQAAQEIPVPQEVILDRPDENKHADETAAKLQALKDCFNDLNWWNEQTRFKPLWGGTNLTVGAMEKRVPHHITVFKNAINHPVAEAKIDEMILAAEKQMPAVNPGFSFGRLFQSPPGTRFCGLFQVRQAPMIALIATVANFKNLSLANLLTELKKIRGNTEWQPVPDVIAPQQNIRPGKQTRSE